MSFEIANTLAVGDCVELLRNLPTGSAQLIVADPPYNLGPTFGIAKEWLKDDAWLAWCKEWLSECQRLLADDGNLFVYGIHHYLCHIQVALYEMGLRYRRQIIWTYQNGFSTPRRSLATHYEPILWFSKTDDYYFAELREPYQSESRLKHRITKNGKVWTPHPDGRIAGDVWAFPTLAGRRFRDEKVDHPTQKPLALTDRIIRHFSEPDSLVVVPFCGSGTECVSALRQGRRYWACDIKPEYIALAASRISAVETEADQLSLGL
jgi:DNA modification methylase